MEYYALTERRTEEAKKIRRETKDRDFSPRRAKELVPRMDGMANNLTATQTVEQLVLVSPKSTNTPNKSISNTSRSIKTMEIAQKLIGQLYQTLTVWSEGSLAKRSLLQESEVDLQTPEVHSFLKSQDALKKNSHAFVCLKTSKAYYLTTKEQHSLQSLPRWMNWGMTANGKCLTARISEFRRTGNECSLSDREKTIDKYLSFL